MVKYFAIEKQINQEYLIFFIGGSIFAKKNLRFERWIIRSSFSKPDLKTEFSFFVTKHGLKVAYTSCPIFKTIIKRYTP